MQIPDARYNNKQINNFYVSLKISDILELLVKIQRSGRVEQTNWSSNYK